MTTDPGPRAPTPGGGDLPNAGPPPGEPRPEWTERLGRWIIAHPVKWTERLGRWIIAHPVTAWGGLIVFLLLLGLTAQFLGCR